MAQEVQCVECKARCNSLLYEPVFSTLQVTPRDGMDIGLNYTKLVKKNMKKAMDNYINTDPTSFNEYHSSLLNFSENVLSTYDAVNVANIVWEKVERTYTTYNNLLSKFLQNTFQYFEVLRLNFTERVFVYPAENGFPPVIQDVDRIFKEFEQGISVLDESNSPVEKQKTAVKEIGISIRKLQMYVTLSKNKLNYIFAAYENCTPVLQDANPEEYLSDYNGYYLGKLFKDAAVIGNSAKVSYNNLANDIVSFLKELLHLLPDADSKFTVDINVFRLNVEQFRRLITRLGSERLWVINNVFKRPATELKNFTQWLEEKRRNALFLYDDIIEELHMYFKSVKGLNANRHSKLYDLINKIHFEKWIPLSQLAQEKQSGIVHLEKYNDHLMILTRLNNHIKHLQDNYVKITKEITEVVQDRINNEGISYNDSTAKLLKKLEPPNFGSYEFFLKSMHTRNLDSKLFDYEYHRENLQQRVNDLASIFSTYDKESKMTEIYR
jgi:hypothetical protein